MLRFIMERPKWLEQGLIEKERCVAVEIGGAIQ
jgi:hypothetical protein